MFNILLLRNRKEDEAETLHTCIGHCPPQKLCFLFQADENSGCYGNLYSSFNRLDDDDCFKVALASRHSGYPSIDL